MNRYVRGWGEYFKRAEVAGVFDRYHRWITRRCAPSWRSGGATGSGGDTLELTRFRGHCSPMGGGVHDAEESTAVPTEFRQRIIELVRKGRTPESLAEQFEPSAQTIRN
jgi:hypothetical protein